MAADAPEGDAVAAAVLDLARARGAGRSLCPSEVARALCADPRGDWRALMPAVRAAAARLQADGQIIVTRAGRPVDPLARGGPIRLRLAGGPLGGDA